jgi:hypothetical protein
MSGLELSDVLVLIDSREQAPYSLAPMRAEIVTLDAGDYSARGAD